MSETVLKFNVNDLINSYSDIDIYIYSYYLLWYTDYQHIPNYSLLPISTSC